MGPQDQSDNKKRYKDTLNLPQTGFDMRAGLLKKEPAVQAKWASEDLYGRIRAARKGAERFLLHDGPPYANGDIHMGHVLNKVLKDMVVRVKTMCGLDSPYVPGWDCHGLPIEAKVMEELGPAAREMSAGAIRQRCGAYADRFAKLQAEQFQRLGVMGEFDDPYITMNPHYEAATLEIFARLVQQGLVYRQLKPVHWSIENRTALAEAELEYRDRKDSSVYVVFRLSETCAGKLPGAAGAASGLMVWTTTPWTLPANRAVAVGPRFEYSVLRLATADGPVVAVVASELVEKVLAASAKREDWLTGHEVLATLKGQELLDLGLTYEHPLQPQLACPVVPAEYVTLEDGTGLVHTAPGHGLEDYMTGLKQDLEIYCPVQADGTFDATAPAWLIGQSVWQANPKVVEYLAKQKTLVVSETITHSYPHDWRSKTPTIFRATEQWFVAVDKQLAGGGESLRAMAMAVCAKDRDEGGVEFVPGWGRSRMLGMLESRPDWCLSRQRSWGLPIPAFYNADGTALLTPASVRAVAEVVAEKGSDAWFELSPAELLAGYDPAEDDALAGADQLPIDQLTAGKDIFDVWWESGSSWFAVALARGLVEEAPVDMYLEGSDQHRGWFQLSLLPALGAVGKAPFRTVLTHGFVVDKDGKKMSKSEGNYISAIEQLEERGADILRLWVASQNYQDDIRCSDELIAQSEDAYRKIRNTLRFCMGSCFDFDPARDACEPTEHSVDQWMRMELHLLVRDVREAYDRYEFHRATRMIYEFCTVQASSVYMAAVKDRLYCESPTALRRRATQTVMHELLVTLVKLLAPILPHTCEEAWEHIPGRDAAEPASVHLALLPDYDEAALEWATDLRPVNLDQATAEPDRLEAGVAWVWQRLLDLRQQGLVKLEALRNAGVKNPLDAEAVFTVAADNEADAKLLEACLKEMEDLLGVGHARLERSAELDEGVKVAVTVADARELYPRCARSWKRRPDVGANPDYPDLCVRDAAVMEEIGAGEGTANSE